MGRLSLFFDVFLVVLLVFVIVSQPNTVQVPFSSPFSSDLSLSREAVQSNFEDVLSNISPLPSAIDSESSENVDSNDFSSGFFAGVKERFTDVLPASYPSENSSQKNVSPSVSNIIGENEIDIYHEVQEGNTVYSIAKLYEVSVEDIVALNDLIDYQIHPKQHLLIQQGELSVLEASASSEGKEALIAFQSSPQKLSLSPQVSLKKESSPSLVNKAINGQEEGATLVYNPRIISEYEPQLNPGIDVIFEGRSPVMAADSGRVLYAGNGLYGYRYLVVVEHSNQVRSAYSFHHDLNVKVGDYLNRGGIIATYSKEIPSNMVRFEVRKKQASLDPVHFL